MYWLIVLLLFLDGLRSDFTFLSRATFFLAVFLELVQLIEFHDVNHQFSQLSIFRVAGLLGFLGYPYQPLFNWHAFLDQVTCTGNPSIPSLARYHNYLGQHDWFYLFHFPAVLRLANKPVQPPYCLPESRVKVVLNAVVCPTVELLGNFRPLVTVLIVAAEQDRFFFARPCLLLNVRIQLIVPSS